MNTECLLAAVFAACSAAVLDRLVGRWFQKKEIERKKQRYGEKGEGNA